MIAETAQELFAEHGQGNSSPRHITHYNLPYHSLCSMELSILGDPGAVSGDGEKSKTGEKKFGRRKVKNEDFSPSPLTAPGSPRMGALLNHNQQPLTVNAFFRKARDTYLIHRGKTVLTILADAMNGDFQFLFHVPMGIYSLYLHISFDASQQGVIGRFAEISVSEEAQVRVDYNPCSCASV